MNEKVIIFVLVGGLQLPSEGILADVQRCMDIQQNNWFAAKHPRDGNEFLIYLPNCLSVMEIDRDKVSYPSMLEKPAIRFN